MRVKRRILCGALVAAMLLLVSSVHVRAELKDDVEWEFWLEKDGEKAREFWFSDEMTVYAQIKNIGGEVIQNPTGVATVGVKSIKAEPAYVFAAIQWAMYTLGRVVPIGLVMPRGQMVVEVPESIEPGESYVWSEIYIVADLIQEIMERGGNIAWTIDKESGKGSMRFKSFPMKYIMPTTLKFDIEEVEVLLTVRLYINDEPTEPQKYEFKIKS
jgi:hypothetical protein